jgi:hypothetical protein
MVLAVRLSARRLSHSAHTVALDGHPSSRLECSGRKRSMGAALQWAATLLLQKACGHERPVVDLLDDLLLPGVALHVVLSARVWPRLRPGAWRRRSGHVLRERCPRSQSRRIRCFTSSGLSNPKTCGDHIHLNSRLAN